MTASDTVDLPDLSQDAPTAGTALVAGLQPGPFVTAPLPTITSQRWVRFDGCFETATL